MGLGRIEGPGLLESVLHWALEETLFSSIRRSMMGLEILPKICPSNGGALFKKLNKEL